MPQFIVQSLLQIKTEICLKKLSENPFPINCSSLFPEKSFIGTKVKETADAKVLTGRYNVQLLSIFSNVWSPISYKGSIFSSPNF